MHVNGADLQFVIHKNDEAGIKQGQHVQRPMAEQAMIGHESDRALQQKRTQTTKTQSTTGRQINANQEEQQSNGRDGKGKQDAKQGKSEQERINEQSGKHPYKGRHIDLTM